MGTPGRLGFHCYITSSVSTAPFSILSFVAVGSVHRLHTVLSQLCVSSGWW
jgi:hypothetical protein